MENRNPESMELSEFMQESQALALKNSGLNAEFADALAECREVCASKLANIFEADFHSLMNDPVESLALNLKPRLNSAVESSEKQQHEAKKRDIQAKIHQMQGEYKQLDQKRSRVYNFINEKLMKI